MKASTKKALAAVTVTLAAGCSSTPQTSERLSTLERDYQRISTDSTVTEHAPLALKNAKESVAEVERLINEDADEEVLDHYTYIAERKIDTAYQLGRYNANQERIENAEEERQSIVLDAKESEIAMAESKLLNLKSQQQQLKKKKESLERKAEQAQEEYQSEQERVSELDKTLKNVSTRKDSRGWVISMTDIEFKSGESDIPSNVVSSLEKVAEVLSQYPERDILIEGYTDNVGSEQFNQNLSELRARSVMEKLTGLGVKQDRMDVVGYGEQFPVAKNSSPQGRKENRRVEIVMASNSDTQVKRRN